MATEEPTMEQILNAPAMEAPEGEEVILDNPPNQNTLAFSIITACLAVSTLCVVLRAYARVYLLRKVQVEEFLIFAAYGVYIGQAYCCYKMLETPGYFVHQWNLLVKDLIPTSYYVLLIGTFYQIVLPLLKTAILMEWIKILGPQGNRSTSTFWWGCVFVIVLQCSFGAACVIALNVQCTPHEAIWEVWMPRDLCWNLVPLQLTSASVQLFSDIIMLLLPQKIIWTLNLSWKKRMGVSLVFGLGILACVSAGFRLGVTVTYGYDDDQMYTLGPVVFWVIAETTCGFFIVCMPCLPKILKEKGIIRRVKGWFGMRVTTAGPSSYGYNSELGGYPGGSRSASGMDPYLKLDESNSGKAMRSVTTNTDSMENLRDPEEGNKGKIMKTTQVVVHYHQDKRSQSDSEDMVPGMKGGRFY